jgi:putative DNA primase/helicase
MNTDNVIYALNKNVVVFKKYNTKEKKWLRCNPPPNVARTLLVKGAWSFPKVFGVTTVPTMRPDGTILDTPGYDPTTQLLYSPDRYIDMPAVGTTREDAGAALKLLKRLLVEFPFVDKNLDQAVALAGMLSPVVRGAFTLSPMTLVAAPSASNGKSFLVDLISAILTGQPCPVLAYTEDEVEMEKRLGVVLMGGLPIVSLDNCVTNLRGKTLCHMTERPIVMVRILGRSELVPCEWRGSLFATGNNVSLEGDLTRRGTRCNLQAPGETSEAHARKFEFNPIATVLANRGLYISALLTLTRAYHLSGETVECPPVASYGPWSKFVREPLMWLGEDDAGKSIDVSRAEDPTYVTAREFYDLVEKYFPSSPKEKEQDGLLTVPFSVSDLVDLAARWDGVNIAKRTNADLYELLSTIGTVRGGEIDRSKIGMWLHSIQNQTHGKRALAKEVKSTGRKGTQYVLRRKS